MISGCDVNLLLPVPAKILEPASILKKAIFSVKMINNLTNDKLRWVGWRAKKPLVNSQKGHDHTQSRQPTFFCHTCPLRYPSVSIIMGLLTTQCAASLEHSGTPVAQLKGLKRDYSPFSTKPPWSIAEPLSRSVRG